METHDVKRLLGKTDMYLIDLLQKGYFDKPLHVLDAGCGKGRNIWMLAEFGHAISACDTNESDLSILQEEVKKRKIDLSAINVRVGEIGKLPYRDQDFDFVICNAVLHFAKDKDHFLEMMRDLTRVVRKGGIIFTRFVSSHTLNNRGQEFNKTMQLPDGTNRFVVDENWLKSEVINGLGLELSEEFKTINIDNKRTMTTLILRAK